MKKLFSLFILFMAVCAAAQNPLLIKQVNGTNLDPGANNNFFYKHQFWNNKLFYYQSNNLGLCVTDGTNAGTQNIFTFTVPAGGSLGSIMFLGPAQDFMYIRFRYYTSPSFTTLAEEIWKSDGTTAGTQFVYLANSSPSSPLVFSNIASDPSLPASIIGNTIFFSNKSAPEGQELWKCDGTTAGTGIVKDIRPGTAGSSPLSFGCIGNKVLFYAGDGIVGRELWSTDGTEAGTVLVKDINPDNSAGGAAAASNSDFLQANTGVLNGKYYFHASLPSTGAEPWVSDGTAAGTFMLKDIVPGTLYSIPLVNNQQFVATNNYIFFKVKNPNRTGTELWRSDGTTTGTIFLSAADSLTSTAAIAATGGNLYFMIFNNGNSGTDSRQYFLLTDGTVAGTKVVDSSYYFAFQPVVYKNGAYCSGTRGVSIGTTGYDNEIIKTDGTRANTGIALDIFPGVNSGPSFTIYNSGIPQKFFVLNNYLYFFGRNATNPFFGLFRYEGDFTFNNSLANGRWRDSANWNSRFPPGLTDTVYLNAGTVNVNGRTASAGVLNLQNGVNVNLVNATDSLQVASRINALGSNNFTGNGVVSLRTFGDDPLSLNGGFSANRLHLGGNVNLLNGNIAVGGNFNLTNGRLLLNDNNLQLTGTTSSITNIPASYIVTNGAGVLSIDNIGSGGRSGNVLYPVGTSSYYNPAAIENLGTADAFSVRVSPGVSSNYTGETPAGGTYVGGAVNATWFINEAITGGSNANVTLQWNAAQELPNFDRTQSRIGHFIGAAWQLSAAGNATGTNPYSFMASGYNSFSPFGVLNNNAVLPVHFLSFSAQKCNNNNVCLSWRTANEINVSHFEVERSKDGINYSVLTTVQAGGNNYLYEDRQADWSSHKLYYRIVEKDIDGRKTFSHVAWLSRENITIQVHPTLISHSFTVQNNSTEKGRLYLSDAMGKIVAAKLIGTGTSIQSTETLPAGVYFYQVVFENNSQTISGKIIKH